jgi:hypothetical protein
MLNVRPDAHGSLIVQMSQHHPMRVATPPCKVLPVHVFDHLCKGVSRPHGGGVAEDKLKPRFGPKVTTEGAQRSQW